MSVEDESARKDRIAKLTGLAVAVVLGLIVLQMFGGRCDDDARPAPTSLRPSEAACEGGDCGGQAAADFAAIMADAGETMAPYMGLFGPDASGTLAGLLGDRTLVRAHLSSKSVAEIDALANAPDSDPEGQTSRTRQVERAWAAAAPRVRRIRGADGGPGEAAPALASSRRDAGALVETPLVLSGVVRHGIEVEALRQGRSFDEIVEEVWVLAKLASDGG